MRLITGWRDVLKGSDSVWAQLGQALFGLLTFLDPASMLAVWNQMPGAVTSRVPPAFVEKVGAVLFVAALVTIVLRLRFQPKLAAKVQEKVEEKIEAKAEERRQEAADAAVAD